MFAFLSLYLFRYSPLSLFSLSHLCRSGRGVRVVLWFEGGGWFPVSLFYLFLPFLSLSLAVILDFVSCFFSSLPPLPCSVCGQYLTSCCCLLRSPSLSFSLHSPSALLSPLSSLLFSFLCCCFLSFFGQFYKMELTANYFFPKRLNFLFPFSVPLLFLSSMSSYLPPRPISSPRPPLPLLPDISSTSSLHHLLVHALASSPRPPLPPFVAVNTYSFDISSVYSPSSFKLTSIFFFNLFSSTLSSSLLLKSSSKSCLSVLSCFFLSTLQIS